MTANRRDFLRLSALAATAGCVLRLSQAAVGATASGMTYGVQLYMVRRQALQDFVGVLKAIHAIGFSQIEMYAMAYNHPAPELLRMVQDAGRGGGCAGGSCCQ